MAAPLKPWELQRNSTVPVYDNQSRGNALASSAAVPTGDTTQIGNPRPTANNPPSIPPRINTRTFGSGYGVSPYRQMGGYGGYSSGYGYGSTGLGYGSTGFGYGRTGLGYGSTGLGYGSYGGYGSGFGSYGYGNSFGYGGTGNDIESRFVQLAEESSRPAFQTIESVVRAFASIAGMMDSTFFAITSSFRAILGVAENFGRLRTLFSQMWTSFAVFRMFNWILKKLLSLIGIRTAGQANDAWTEAISSQAVGQGAAVLNESRPSGWPVAMFLGVILSAPYVISRLFSSTMQETQNQPPPGYRKAKAIHNFVARSQNEINLTAGQIIWIAPSQIQVNYNLPNTGWIFVQNSNGQSGIVPINHIAVYHQAAQQNPAVPQPSTSKEENVETPIDISNLEPSIK